MRDVYRAYGLTVSSDIPLPELPAGSGPVHLTIRHAELGETAAFDERGVFVAASSGKVEIAWDGVGFFRVTQGSLIEVQPAAGAAATTVRNFLLGAVLSVLLHQRGVIALHGSAVSVGGRAAIFVGPKGAGKSTTAASLRVRGHQLISDDVGAITLTDDDVLVHPGLARMNMFPDSLTAVGGNPERHPRIHPGYEKRAVRLTENLAIGPVPAGAVYLLDVGESIVIEELDPISALPVLFANSNPLRVGAAVVEAGDAGAYFLRMGQIRARIPVRRLRRPRDLEQMTAVAAAIERQFEADRAAETPREDTTP